MIRWICYAVIGIFCFVIVTAVLAIPSMLMPPGIEFGSMSAAYGIAAVISYFSTPIIYRKIAGMIKR